MHHHNYQFISIIWAFPPYLKTKVSYSLDYVYIASPALLLSIAPLDESIYIQEEILYKKTFCVVMYIGLLSTSSTCSISRMN